jgi:uncharacterized protein (UPF0332 family)
MNLTLVRAEWQRAAQALGAADVLRQAGYPADALSRAYYATLHAAKAALAVPEVPTTSHAAVRRMFGLHLIQTGAIEGTWGSRLAEILDDRLAADYDVEAQFTGAEATDACQQARAFLERIRTYLLANQVPAENLRLDAPPPP